MCTRLGQLLEVFECILNIDIIQTVRQREIHTPGAVARLWTRKRTGLVALRMTSTA